MNVENAVAVPVDVPSEPAWTLFIEPLSGSWYPSWKLPLIGAVVAISFVIGLLVFLALFYYLEQKDQLGKTKELLQRLAQEVQRSDKLLFRMLPPFAADKLRKGQAVEARDYPSVSILFTVS